MNIQIEFIFKTIFLIGLALFSLKVRGQEIVLASPSGKVFVQVTNSARLSYQVRMESKVIIRDSPMGFLFKNEPAMGDSLLLLDKSETEINESWIPVVKSKHAQVRDHYKALLLSFIEHSGLRRRMDVEFRVYDDGVAFRYRLYGSQKIGQRQIVKELTRFNLAGDAWGWVSDQKGYRVPQEEPFLPLRLSGVPDTTKVGLPLLIEIDKQHYAAITEAKVDNYPGFFIGVNKAADGTVALGTKLSPLPFETEDGIKARFSGGIYTPWRVIMLGSSPGSLIESELIQNLNDPCAIADPSWIKPGISAWDHWWSGEINMQMPVIKKYIDFAAVQGWPYMLVDWQWYGTFDNPKADLTKTAPHLDMPELLRYAKEKKVRLWLWMTSSDANRNDNYKKAFALYEKWGIAGVKIDFMDRSDQDMVNWYHEIIKCAAEHHLMVDFHGAYKPDGIIRTWPNMITREGVMGNEYTKWSEKMTPEHNVTLPFTRMLAGQMDYTPGGFLNVTRAEFKAGQPAVVMNTRCQELAKFVVYESPLTVFCDHPDYVLGQPGTEFLKIVPTVWDDTRVLSGYPGEHIALVKKTGDRYFLGAMNNSVGRSLKLKLDFLPAGRYEMTSWADAKDADVNPKNLLKTIKVVTAKDMLNLKMAIGGGFVAELKPLN